MRVEKIEKIIFEVGDIVRVAHSFVADQFTGEKGEVVGFQNGNAIIKKHKSEGFSFINGDYFFIETSRLEYVGPNK